MIPSRLMATQILCIAGPTASGKSARAVEIALGGFVNPSSNERFTKPFMGEIISVDSRQVYRGLDIGTEKIHPSERRGVPHHLIDIRDVDETYSAGDFVSDATRLIKEICSRGKLPILVGGTHFYFDALVRGLPAGVDANPELREQLESLTTDELFALARERDPRRAHELDPRNRRRLIRALEIIESKGSVPLRPSTDSGSLFQVKWIVIDPPREELRARIDARLRTALERGLIEEVRTVRDHLANHNFRGRESCGYAQADARLNELGLEYKIVGEFLRNEPDLEVQLPSGSRTSKLFSALSAKLWQYARRQKAWLRKLKVNEPVTKNRVELA